MSRKRINPADLKRGPIRHDELPLLLVARINYIRSTLHDVHPMSMEEWLDGFRRDANPESEILWWERLTRLYTGYCDTRDLSAGQKHALFRVLFKMAMGTDPQALESDFANLPEGALEVIVALAGGGLYCCHTADFRCLCYGRDYLYELRPQA